MIAPLKYLISPLNRLRFRSTILEREALDQTQAQTQTQTQWDHGLLFRWPRVSVCTYSFRHSPSFIHSLTHSYSQTSDSDKTLHTHTRPAVPRPGCAPCPVVLAGHVWLYLLVLRQTHTKPGTTDMTILCRPCREPLLDLLLRTRPGPSWRSPADTAPSDNPGFREGEVRCFALC